MATPEKSVITSVGEIATTHTCVYGRSTHLSPRTGLRICCRQSKPES